MRGIHYESPVASAQVKSCVLLAGLYAEGETSVTEPVRTRDHTEIALRELGADIKVERRRVVVQGGIPLAAKNLVVPGDISSAAFFLVAATIAKDAELVIANVGLNPTRTALLDFLNAIGARIKIMQVESVNGELIGNLQVTNARTKGGEISGALAAALIDEIPVLAILGALSEEGLVVKDAGELRVKETDRIATVAENLSRMGVNVETRPDGMAIPGKQRLHAAQLTHSGIIVWQWRLRWRRSPPTALVKYGIRKRRRYRILNSTRRCVTLLISRALSQRLVHTAEPSPSRWEGVTGRSA